MTILFINRFYWPEESGSGKVLSELASDLVAAGHAVSVVTSSALIHEPGRRLSSFESHAGVSIHRVFSFRFNRTSVVGWLLNALSFYPFVLLRILRLPAHSVVVFLTDPPLLFCLGPVVRFFKGSRIVCWSQDLYPDVAVALGVLSSSSMSTRLWSRLASSALSRFDRVIALGDSMKARLVFKGVSASRIAVCHNWADSTLVRPVPFPASFTVMYSGNFGLSHEFSTLLGAVSRLSGSGVRFVFVGSGKQYASVKVAAGASATFLPFVPEASLGMSLGSASVHVVSLKAGLAGLLVPSKVYGVLAAGRPVVYIGEADSEVGELVVPGACGFVIAPGDVAGLVSVISRLQASPEECQALGARARDVLLSTYDRKIGTSRILSALEGVAVRGEDGRSVSRER